jgi:thymidylate synthase (FAD)
MRLVEPKVFLIGEPKIREVDLRNYLRHIGAPDWFSDAPTDAEKLVEVMGRLCYRSFKPGLNPNVTKVRKGNRSYIENVIGQEHGSVLEHAVFNFIFADVSRVFTHELVRHRAGTAISQESLRFVRVEDIGFWPPTVIREDRRVMEIFSQVINELEDIQRKMSQRFGLDRGDVPFYKKKVITSALRRILPEGVATTIGWSANVRTIRWVLELRTAPEAEEEIRYVFGKVGEIMVKEYKNFFFDFEKEVVDGIPWWKPKYRKV